MNERNKWIYGGLGLIALVALLLFLFSGTKEESNDKKNVSQEDDSERSMRSTAKSLFDDPEFAEAPTPDDDELSQAESLWPAALERKPDRKEKVKEEWRDFAAKYPKNFYIPKEMRPARTEAEEKAVIQDMENFTALDASYASSISKNKWAEAGSTPSAEPAKPPVAQQKAYFDYKINELESRIQMVEYWMASSQPNGNDKAIAEKDMKLWKAELTTLQEVKGKIPKS